MNFTALMIARQSEDSLLTLINECILMNSIKDVDEA
jgi:hypothetical protein